MVRSPTAKGRSDLCLDKEGSSRKVRPATPGSPSWPGSGTIEAFSHRETVAFVFTGGLTPKNDELRLLTNTSGQARTLLDTGCAGHRLRHPSCGGFDCRSPLAWWLLRDNFTHRFLGDPKGVGSPPPLTLEAEAIKEMTVTHTDTFCTVSHQSPDGFCSALPGVV